MKLYLLVAAVVFSAGVNAHGGVWAYTIGGKEYLGYKWWYPPTTSNYSTIQRKWPSLEPIYDLASPYLACNLDGSPAASSFHAPIIAGDTIGSHWSGNYSNGPAWPPPQEPWTYSSDIQGWAHDKGPMMVYMADCGGPCEGFNFTNRPVWFKIEERGLVSGRWKDGYWAQRDIQQGAVWNTTIPKNLKPGYYLIRHELVVFPNTPLQHFLECAQLQVLGDGNATPGPEYLASFPGAYSDSDPGLNLSTWTFYNEDQMGNNTVYIIPGPKLWEG